MLFGIIQSGRRNVEWLLIGRRWEKLTARLIGDAFELLNSGRPIDVARYGQDFFLLLDQAFGELAHCRGFTGTLQASHQNDRGWLRGEVELRCACVVFATD